MTLIKYKIKLFLFIKIHYQLYSNIFFFININYINVINLIIAKI